MKYLLAAFLISTSTSLSAASYLCVSDQASGFLFEGGNYELQVFGANLKFLLRPAIESDDTDWEYVVVPLGGEYPISQCEFGFGSGDTIYCHDRITLMMNRKSLRFEGHQWGWSWHPETLQRKNVVTYIGTCSPAP